MSGKGGEHSYEAAAPLVAALVAAAFAGAAAWPLPDFALDDAWIHLDYAKSLRLGEGWSYNPFDHEAGCSSPLWVALLRVWPTGGNPVPRVLALAVLLHAATASVSASLAIAIGRRQASAHRPLPLRAMAMLAGVLVATAPLGLHGVASGMEVALASCLAIAVLWAIVEGRAHAAGSLGALAVFARPELGLWCASAVVVCAVLGRRRDPATFRAAVIAAAGATAAVVIWAIWLALTVGSPVPNAFHVKGRGGQLAGVSYVASEVLSWTPWVVGLGGLLLAVAALRAEWRGQGRQLSLVLGIVVLTTIGVAVSRPLHPGVGFFESRYFAPLLAPATVIVAFGVAALHRVLAIICLVPIAVITGLQDRETAVRVRAAADDTRVLHTQPARWLAAELPPDAVVAVEGAGASRFFTPRTMTIVDLVGLNDHVAARRHFDRAAKICRWIERRPPWAVVPEQWLPILGGAFRLKVVATFDDPNYTQVEPPHQQRVVVVALAPADGPAAACDPT